jgi:hypothetical protein
MAGIPIEGIQGQGKAGIFGGSVNPLAVYMQYQAGKQKRQDLLDDEMRKQRDKLIDDNDKFAPKKTWEPIYEEVNQYVQNNVRNAWPRLREQGYSIEAARNIINRAKSEADVLASRGNVAEMKYNEAAGQIKDEEAAGHFIKGYYRPKLNDRIYNGPYAKPLAEIPDDHSEIFKDSKGYNMPFIAKEIMDDLPMQIIQDETEKAGLTGSTFDQTKIGDKLGWRYDATGKPIIDPRTGRNATSLTDEVFYNVRKNPYVAQWLEDNYGVDAPLEKQREGVANILGVYNPRTIEHNITQGHKYENNGDGSGQSASIVGAGDNALKTYENIGGDKQIGFDSISFGYSSPVQIPFSNTQGGSADQTGAFSGLRTNPSTGKKEMEFVTTKPYGTPGEKEIKYVPYDEKTFQQVLNSLPKNKRDELRKLKGDFETQYANKKEYVLDESKLNSDADQITKFYDQNKDHVGSDAFNSGFSELINKLGLDKNAKSNKTFWWFNPNELTIGDQTVQAGDKEKLKQVLYNLQKGKYKKQKGKSTTTEADELGLN